MNGMKRRVLCLLMAVLMVVTAFPATVFAEETTEISAMDSAGGTSDDIDNAENVDNTDSTNDISAPELPTATVTEIAQENLTFALNFVADEVTDEQLAYYGDWYADFVLTINKTVTFNANGGADGYLSGQYDKWSENWVSVPFEDVTLSANEPLKIMEYASKLMNQQGLKYTYKEVYESVKDFDCGLYFTEAFLAANPDMQGTLELRMYNPANEEESYAIGDTYEFGALAQNKQTGKFYDDLKEAFNEANEGNEVLLLRNAETFVVSVPEGITFDLNGYELDTEYVTCFGNIVDGSDKNSAVLGVAPEHFLIQESNAQLPVNSSEGYKFYENTGYNARYLEASRKFAFQPLLEAASHDAIAQGAQISGATVNVRVSWTQADGLRTQDFVYSDNLVSDFLYSYDAESGKFSQMFTLTLNGTENFDDLKFSAVVVSNTGVELASAETTVKKAGTEDVTTDDNNQVTEEVTIKNDKATAVVGEGTQLNADTTSLTLTTEEMNATGTNIQLGEGETMRSLDVHVEGVSADNTKPILITLEEIAPEYLNQGNIALYHVEDGVTAAMTRVATLAEVDAHNEYYYDILTGTITMALVTFSEVAVVADTENAWNGTVATVFAGGSGAEADPYIIANADQLAYLGDRVSNDNADYGDKYYKLVADVNIGGIENYNANGRKVLFYPIGYNKVGGTTTDKGNWYTYGGSFRGTFDGNGHTITGIYQNTWAMVGDYSGTYYNDAMGLFGYVNGGTVKNLTIDNFYSEGEFAPTGCITAYAAGNATFENIAITNSHPQTYNTGVAGIVGWDNGGDTETEASKFTFKNITIDSTNTISALWGSWDVAAAGLMGYLGEFSKADLTNCNVSATIDVYNDVCGNYQYYWYRYCGMLIGTVDKTDAEGNLDLSNITATNCTVNFGDRHEYFYCEFVDNSIASYTHDYQFSRVAHSNLKFTDSNENGRVDTAEVSSVTGCTHDHELSGFEEKDIDGDGVIDSDVLKEDKQAVYIPFYQLFGGYGWGVDGVTVDEYNNLEINVDRKIITGEEVSVEKFEVIATTDTYTTGTTIKVGELFSAIAGVSPEINKNNVQVTISPVGDDSTADGNYTANTTDWTQGTLTFSGFGSATITIQDYNYCIPTTITVNIVEQGDVDKFDIVFPNTNDYLYRVGNVNTVALGSLFKAIDGAEIGDVTINIEALNGASVSGTYTANTTDWTKGTIQFSDTGPVKVTIDDDAYANEVVLYLEVVNATNVTAYSGLGNRNSVLLNDITMSSGSSYYLSGATLYGNGFTFDMTDATYAAGGNISSNYVFGLNNANLDNVKIVGAVYTTYGATVQDAYNRAAVLSSGNNAITNCYISNCASAVRVKDGNLEIVNSTIKGGNFANIDIRGGHVILDNITTINQVNGNDTAEDGAVVVGLGVVVYYEKVLPVTTVEIRNGITQYNYLSEKQSDEYITGAYADKLMEEIFADSYSDLQYVDSSNVKWVNTGIVSMTDAVGADNISGWNSDEYIGKTATFNSVEGYVVTTVPKDESIYCAAPEYVTIGQGAIAPNCSFDYTSKNYLAKEDGSNDYCYESEGTVYLSMDEGDSFNWDTSILSATKNGQTLNYSVTMNGTDYTGKSIAFNQIGNYEVLYSYTDSNNYRINEDSNIVTYEKSYTKTVHVSVAVITPETKHAEFTMGSSNAATEKITIDNVTYVSATGVTADNSTWTYITIGDQKIYYPIVAAKLTSTKGSSSYAYFPVFENVVTITDYTESGTGDAFTYNSSTVTLPSTLTAVKGTYKAASDVPYWYNLNNSHLTQSGPSKIFKWASSSDAPSDPTTYNNVLCFKSPQISADRVAYITLVQYSYTDATNTTYYYYVGYTLEAFTKQTTCVTPETLITLADGTQKRIDTVTTGDQFLVWDFVKGEYATAPASILMNHGYDTYTITTLRFDDGTAIKTIDGHGFYHKDTNEFILLSEANAADYIDHGFLKQDMETVVNLVDYSVETQYTECWSILTSEYYNCILEGMLTITPAEVEDSPKYLMPFKVNDDLKYDEAARAADIRKYGLYTYEEFEDLVTYEEFIALNLPIFKVSVGKGYITYDEILYLLDIHAKK